MSIRHFLAIFLGHFLRKYSWVRKNGQSIDNKSTFYLFWKEPPTVTVGWNLSILTLQVSAQGHKNFVRIIIRKNIPGHICFEVSFYKPEVIIPERALNTRDIFYLHCLLPLIQSLRGLLTFWKDTVQKIIEENSLEWLPVPSGMSNWSVK